MASKRSSKRRGGITPRRVATKELRQRFLIVCEGEKTEPNYFRSFRVPREVMTIHGIGANTVSLVQKAIELRDADEFDQVWCVFDRDSFPAENFNRALILAEKERINVAYSNEAFELWYLLHFHYYNTGISRADYIRRLSDLLGHRYKKNSVSIYDELVERQPRAILHARRLLSEYDPPNPERDNPSTTVHLLVEQLIRFVR
jgi:hypothetical protein